MGDPIVRRGTAVVYGLAAIVAITVALLAGCSSGSAPNSASPNPSAGTSTSNPPLPNDPDTQAIANAFTQFFSGKTPAAGKIALLQNGQRFAQVINGQAGGGMAASTTATVSRVHVTNPTDAAVTYSIDMNGTPVLANQQGRAVKQDGSWKVADTTFCTLLKLEGTTPSACPGAH